MKPVAAKPSLRHQQRVDVAIEAKLYRPDGTAVFSKVANLSRAGMMIECDTETAKTLIPGTRTPAPGYWIDVISEFSVPVVANQPVSIRADSHIVYLRRMSRDRFQIGIQFMEFDGNGYHYVDQFVSSLMFRDD